MEEETGLLNCKKMLNSNGFGYIWTNQGTIKVKKKTFIVNFERRLNYINDKVSFQL